MYNGVYDTRKVLGAISPTDHSQFYNSTKE